VQNINSAFKSLTRMSKHDVLGKVFYQLDWVTDLELETEVIWGGLQSLGFWSGEVKKKRRDGSEYIVQANMSAVKNKQGELLHYVMLLTEIDELNDHQRSLKLSAHHDPLTKLPNRLMLTDRLNDAMLELQASDGLLMAVIFIDIDDFKTINDQLSHATGNDLLLQVSARLRHQLLDSDVISRLGGDEFVVVVNQKNTLGEIQQAAQKIADTFRKPFEIERQPIQVGASIGVTVYPQEDELDADQLIRQADQAMFQAKQSGKNRIVYFDTEQDKHIRGRFQNIARIKNGLRHKEFELYYQPKVNMRTGQVYGLEGLIRWHHPTQGLLSPQQFLPALDNHHFSITLGEWVIEQALNMIEQLHQQGLAIPISVNIDAIHIQQPDFMSMLSEQLKAHPDVKPEWLELEILERAALNDIVQVSQVIDECKDLGVRIALDDFGTGYSSLTYLKRLKANALKIDKSFVRDMLSDPDDLAILEGVIGLATAFQRTVVAEGVETEEHIKLLLRLGCDIGQGYAFARPMPPHQVESWIRNWNATHRPLSVARIAPARIPVLYAMVEHRAWVKHLKLYLQGWTGYNPSYTKTR
jgi:diguanylate cyclase (GGDEF)-like protein/PAS domain S-box-containing protein